MRQDEHNEQVRLFAWAGREAEEHPELGLLFAVPNGGRRDAVTGARLKAEGVKAGVPDVWLPVARGGFHGLVIELKAGARRASREQAAWMGALAREGYAVSLCYGADEAKGEILNYLALEAGG